MLTALPDTITAGTTVEYKKSFTDRPADDGWTAKLYLRGASARDVTATADGIAFKFLLTTLDTGALAAGTYTWAEIVSKGIVNPEIHEEDRGYVTILASVAAASAGDMALWEETTAEVVRAAIRGDLTEKMQAYQIAGRAVTRYSLIELRKILRDLEGSIAARRRGGSAIQVVKFGFGG